LQRARRRRLLGVRAAPKNAGHSDVGNQGSERRRERIGPRSRRQRSFEHFPLGWLGMRTQRCFRSSGSGVGGPRPVGRRRKKQD
jgi:hypothetical protein